MLDTQGGLFVTKFRGAGQGVKALIAEVIVGTLARAAQLPTPELALTSPSHPRSGGPSRIQRSRTCCARATGSMWGSDIWMAPSTLIRLRRVT